MNKNEQKHTDNMNEFIHFDWYMKRMLRDKANYVIVEGLLTVLLGRPIKIKTLLESEGNREHAEDKFNRVDLLAEDTDGELMIFEIQNNRELDYFHRILYGTAKAVTEYLNLGDPYSHIRKVYSINIVYFDLGQGKDYVYHGCTEFVGLHNPDDVLQLSHQQKEKFRCETPADIFPEYYLIKVNNFNQIAATPLDEWVSYLKTGEITAEDTAPGLAEARMRMRVDALSPTERKSYLRDMENLRYQRSVLETSRIEGHAKGLKKGLKKGRKEGRAEGLKEGLTKGREEGEHEKALAIARQMQAKGIPLETILECTGLSAKELEAVL